MKTLHFGRLAIAASSLFLLGTLAACASGPKPVQSAQAGSTTLTLSAPGGRLVNGSNTVTVRFADASGKPEVVQGPHIRFFMPAMGAMAMMDEKADLNSTDKPGVYQATVDLPSTGTWQTTVGFTVSAGARQSTFNVQIP